MVDTVGDEEIPFAYEATATAHTAQQMARAFASRRWHQRGAQLSLLLLAALICSAMFLMYEGDGVSIVERVLGSLLWGGLVAGLIIGGGHLLGVRINTRMLSKTVRPGTVQRTGFGDTAFVTQNDLSSARYSYRAVRSVDSHRGFVFIRFVGQPIVRVYPQSLFPSTAMTQLQQQPAARA